MNKDSITNRLIWGLPWKCIEARNQFYPEFVFNPYVDAGTVSVINFVF